MSNQKKQVVDLLKAIETGASEPVGAINPQHYTQHNLGAADGLAGFGALMAQLPKGSARATTHRVFEDGPFVFAHTEYDFFGPKIGFDIFRFENGKIVEHWDNLQTTAGPNPSGRTMIDGPTKVDASANTEASKTLVHAFVEDILVNGKMDKLAGYFGERYLQHNPHIADDLSGLGAALQAMAKQGITMKYSRIHKVLGEGDFVLVVSEGEFAGNPSSFYDLFRVANGKIAALGHDRDDSAKKRVEKRQRKVRILSATTARYLAVLEAQSSAPRQREEGTLRCGVHHGDCAPR